MAASDALELELAAGPHGPEALRPLSFRVDEAVSSLYEVEVVAHPGQDVAVDAEALLGEAGALTLRLGEADPRHFHGVVARVRLWRESSEERGRRVALTLVPRLWRLTRRSRSRIFQGQSAPDIVAKVLDEGGVAFRRALSGSYPKREYCVQYNESDFAFVSRLLEEEGIFYFFEHEAEAHTLVLGDAGPVHPDIPGEARVPFRAAEGMAQDVESFDVFSAAWEAQSGKVTLRDFDPTRPALDLSTNAQADGGEDTLEVYDYPGRYQEAAEGKRLARVRLEERRLRRCVLSGASTCRRLAPGHTFELEEHPMPELNGPHLLLSVQHRGSQPEVLGAGSGPGASRPQEPPAPGPAPTAPRYRNEVTCVPNGTPERPSRVTPRPLILGAQTAMVVGPSGEEIYCDEAGRVKVQFHWDREGRRDEHSSCFIRVSQAWAGAFRPRSLAPARIGEMCPPHSVNTAEMPHLPSTDAMTSPPCRSICGVTMVRTPSERAGTRQPRGTLPSGKRTSTRPWVIHASRPVWLVTVTLPFPRSQLRIASRSRGC